MSQCNSLCPNAYWRKCVITELISRSISCTEVCCGADRAVCLLSHTRSQLGAYAARRAVGTQHLKPRGRGSVPTQLLAGCHPSFLSLKTSLPLFLILHPCIFTPPYSSEKLQVLSCPHIFFTHRLSKHTGDPVYLFFCMHWVFSIHVA